MKQDHGKAGGKLFKIECCGQRRTFLNKPGGALVCRECDGKPEGVARFEVPLGYTQWWIA